MKQVMQYCGLCFLGGIGYCAGVWLWDNVLEDKVEDLKDRLTTKAES